MKDLWESDGRPARQASFTDFALAGALALVNSLIWTS